MFALAMAAALTACNVEEERSADKTITANAESPAQWNQKFLRQVRVGTSLESATALLEASGFRCWPKFRDGNAICNKHIGKDIAGPTYHWRVDFWSKRGVITTIRTGFDHNTAD